MDELKQFKKAQAAIEAGDTDLARYLLDNLLVHFPKSEKGWLALSKLVNSPQEEADCLRRVISINPDSLANSRLAELKRSIARTGGDSSAPRDKIWKMLERGPLEAKDTNYLKPRREPSDESFSGLLKRFKTDSWVKKLETISGFLLFFSIMALVVSSPGKHSNTPGNPLFFQYSIFFLVPAFLLACGLFIWKKAVLHEPFDLNKNTAFFCIIIAAVLLVIYYFMFR